MTLKDYYKILGADTKAKLGQLDSKFKEHVDRIILIADKEKGIKVYSKILEAYFILRLEEPKAVYEECLDKIKDKDSKEYSDYEQSLKKRFNKIILKANSKVKRNYKNLDKNKDWQIILEMINRVCSWDNITRGFDKYTRIDSFSICSYISICCGFE